MRHGAIIYANILTKADEQMSLDQMSALHQLAMTDSDPGFIFSFQWFDLSDSRSVVRKALLRRASSEEQWGDEHALYIDYGEAVLLLVLNAPPHKSEEQLPLLFALYKTSFRMRVIPPVREP